MAIYAVLAKGTGPLISAALSQAYPAAYYTWSNETFFLRTNNSPKEIGAALGVMNKDENGNTSGAINSAVIFALQKNYWGFTEPNLWSWLKTAFEAELHDQ